MAWVLGGLGGLGLGAWMSVSTMDVYLCRALYFEVVGILLKKENCYSGLVLVFDIKS